jgi:hypothetical protein
MDADLNPYPAYQSFSYTMEQIGGASYSGRITEYSGITGYSFIQNAHTVWLIWSLDGNSYSIELPSVPLSINDVFGNSLPISETISVDVNPIYITFP